MDNENFIQLRVVYDDSPDIIEMGVSIRYGEWSAYSTAFAGPSAFANDARRLLSWVSSPELPIQIEAGADNGMGWMVLKFSKINSAGHVCCAVKLVTGEQSRYACSESTWRFEIELPTELGLVERFARECIAISSDFSLEARLIGVLT